MLLLEVRPKSKYYFTSTGRIFAQRINKIIIKLINTSARSESKIFVMPVMVYIYILYVIYNWI